MSGCVFVCKDVASLILCDLSIYSTIELMSIALVCKNFHASITQRLPDYGIKANLNTLLQVKEFDCTVDEILQSGNVFIFGSFLLCALHMVKGNIGWYPGDLDLFCSVKRLKHKTGLLSDSLLLSGKLGKICKDAKSNPGKSEYDELDSFAVFSNKKVDFVVGIQSCRYHICRSDISMNRSIYGKDGFKTQSIASFFKTQVVSLRCTTDSGLVHFMRHVEKFAEKGLQNVQLDVPCDDVDVFRIAIESLKKGDKVETLSDSVRLTIKKT